MKDILRRLLLLPRDIAVDVLHTPMTWGGWGWVWLPVLCELNFMSSFLSVFECRSVLTRTVLREQLKHPLPGVNDNGSVFRRLCRKYQVTVGVPPHVRPAVDLSLPPSLVRAPILFVTTDAGHMPGDLHVVQGKGGIGIIFSTGEPMQSTMRWRLPLNTFPSRRPCCGPASCGKAERAPRAWGFSWRRQKWQPHPSRSPWGRTDLMPYAIRPNGCNNTAKHAPDRDSKIAPQCHNKGSHYLQHQLPDRQHQIAHICTGNDWLMRIRKHLALLRKDNPSAAVAKGGAVPPEFRHFS